MVGIRRSLLIANSEIIKDNYTEIEYASFDGNMYIDLGIKAGINTKVYIRFYNTKSSNSQIFGSTTNPYYYLSMNNSNKFIFGYAETDYSTSTTSCSLNEWHTAIMDNSGVTLDNTLIQSFSSSLSSFTTDNLKLGDSFTGRISIIRLYENDILTHELIPVIDYNNEVCFYDKFTHRFNYPIGGTLTAGRKIYRVEYLRNEGSCYINTGIANWDNSLEEEVKCTVENQSGTHSWWGAYNTPWTSASRQVPNITTWSSLKPTNSFRAGTSSTSGVSDIGIAFGQTGVFSLKGDTLSWSEGTTASFDRLTSSPFTMNQAIVLFCQHRGTTFDQFAKTSIYYAKFWLNSILVGHFQPAKDENNVGFMFDELTHKIFDNAGSGSFILPS